MEDFKEECFKLREALKEFEAPFRSLIAHQFLLRQDTEEMSSNVILAFRHLEDCRMRLGKAIQAYDGGTSVYPR